MNPPPSPHNHHPVFTNYDTPKCLHPRLWHLPPSKLSSPTMTPPPCLHQLWHPPSQTRSYGLVLLHFKKISSYLNKVDRKMTAHGRQQEQQKLQMPYNTILYFNTTKCRNPHSVWSRDKGAKVKFCSPITKLTFCRINSAGYQVEREREKDFCKMCVPLNS